MILSNFTDEDLALHLPWIDNLSAGIYVTVLDFRVICLYYTELLSFFIIDFFIAYKVLKTEWTNKERGPVN